MEKKTPQNIIFFTIVVILLVGATYFITSIYLNSSYQTQISNINQTYQTQINFIQEQNLNFFKEYSVALNNIHIASSYSDLANVNLNKLNEYTAPNGTGYVYEFAVLFADLGKEQATKSKDYLTKAKTKLGKIKDSAPNEFFKEEISGRIEQVNLLIIYADQSYNLLDYAKQQLYEVNYGSQTKATEYWDKYNTLIPESNANLKKLSDIQNKIDIQWDQDWYPTFQDSAK